jgi:hypothetical protein
LLTKRYFFKGFGLVSKEEPYFYWNQLTKPRKEGKMEIVPTLVRREAGGGNHPGLLKVSVGGAEP